MGFQSTLAGFTYHFTKIMYVNQELSMNKDVQLISVTYFQSNTVLKAKIWMEVVVVAASQLRNEVFPPDSS